MTIFMVTEHDSNDFRPSDSSSWDLGFLGKKIPGNSWVPAKVLTIIFNKARKILQFFQKYGKKPEKVLGFIGKKSKIIKDLDEESKRILPFPKFFDFDEDVS